MKPEISHFPNSQFYESGVKDGSNVLSQNYGMHLAGALNYGTYAFVNCKSGAEVAQQKSLKNPQEVAVVTEMVKHLGQGTTQNDLTVLLFLVPSQQSKTFFTRFDEMLGSITNVNHHCDQCAKRDTSST